MNSFLLLLRNHPFRLLVPVLLFVVIFGGWQLWPRSHDLSIAIEPQVPGFTVKVYKGSGEGNQELLEENLVATVTQNQTLSLREGKYLIRGGPAPDFRVVYEEVELKDNSSVTLSPEYSDDKLATLLQQESSAIQQAIRSGVYGFNDSYRLGPGRLYSLGEWYGTIIYPNLSSEELRLQYVDVFRLVMKKENGNWKLVTEPPQLVLGAPDYPEIPKDVLNSVNDQKLP